MDRRDYLRSLSALFATTFLGGSAAVAANSRSERALERADRAATRYDSQPADELTLPAIPEDNLNFFLANDLGRNGYYEQKTIAELMGRVAERIDIEFVVAPGDIHHFNGVASTQDPLWMTNYELIYSHPDLMIDWFATCGNHEYRGNTRAVLDYGRVSRRWMMRDRYYSRLFELDKEMVEIFFIDTTPLIGRYREKEEKYPDAGTQSIDDQLRWLEGALSASKAKWKIVTGHHPLYADTDKSESERTDMRRHVEPLLDKYEVDMYLCGHIHNFQHIKPAGSRVDYVVNSAGSLSRRVKAIEGTRFCNDEAGFTLFSINDNAITFYMMNGKGKVLYQYTRTK